MSVNKYSPHIVVLPEDQANSDMVNGFLQHPQLEARSIQVLHYAGGWEAVVEKFRKHHMLQMGKYSERRFLLLIDFDKKESRLDDIKRKIPDDVKDRVFVLGVWSNPEELKKALGKSLESIGESLSENCSENIDVLWSHDLLKHNKAELERMSGSVKSFLFRQGG
jgi:hypothetical protein